MVTEYIDSRFLSIKRGEKRHPIYFPLVWNQFLQHSYQAEPVGQFTSFHSWWLTLSALGFTAYSITILASSYVDGIWFELLALAGEVLPKIF